MESLKRIAGTSIPDPHAASHNVGGADTPLPIKYLDKGDHAVVAVTFDWTVATSQRAKMTGSWSSLTFVAPPTGTWVAMIVEQDATGGRVLPAFPATVIWIPGGTLPTFTTTASKKMIISGPFDGTNYILSYGANA